MRWLAWARGRFWLIPLACTALAVGLGLGAIALDGVIKYSLQLPFLLSSGVDGARATLSAIVGSMITFTGLVFSITIVTLQLTSGQFSPRVLRTFLQDRFNPFTLGVFVATFVFAMVVLRSVRGGEEGERFVPQLGVAVAFLFVLASVVVFLIYIHHMAQSIRAATIVALIGKDTRDLIKCRHPRTLDEPDTAPHPASDGQVEPAHLVAATRSGVIVTSMTPSWPGWPKTAAARCTSCGPSGSSCQPTPPCSASTASTLPRISNCGRESSSLRNAP